MMRLDFALLLQYLPQLAQGFGLTLLTWIAGTLIGIALGFAIAVAQALPGRFHRGLIQVYTDVVRGIPFLVQLFLVYYGGPQIGLRGDALTVGILMLGIYGSPYFSEIFRASFRAVPAGQIEAARAMGLGRATIMVRIVLPQMLVVALPAIVNMAIVTLKESAILSIITVPELTFQVTGISSDTFAFAECFLVLALVYWGLVELAMAAGKVAERRVTAHLTPQPIPAARGSGATARQ
jgi:polar amino acid transport system permease protein